MSVYLIGNEANRLVKIGTSRKPSARLRQLQSTCPVRLTLLWTSADHWSYRMEQALHGQFGAQRRHGEWFDFGDLDPVEPIALAVENLANQISETVIPELVTYQPITRGVDVSDLRALIARHGLAEASKESTELLASLCVYGEDDGITFVHPATWRSA